MLPTKTNIGYFVLIIATPIEVSLKLMKIRFIAPKLTAIKHTQVSSDKKMS